MNRLKELRYLFLIFVIFIAACIETDIFLPALPDMMSHFFVSEGAVQGLLTWNFIGICLAGPLYGPVSDSFGRKRPLMIALATFLAGSLLTLFASSFNEMLWGRILQGLGSGGCFTLGTAIIFDAFQKENAVKAINKLNMAIPIIMAGAPMLGGYLNQSYGFRSNFLAIVLFVLVSFFVSLFFFEETLPKEKRAPLKVKAIATDFKLALTSLAFWQITLMISFVFAGYIAFLSNTSVLFVLELGVSKAAFPFFQAAILGGWVVAGLLLNRIIAKWGTIKIKRAGTLLFAIGGVAIAIAALVAPRSAYLLTSGMVVYAFGANWLIGLYFPEGMEILPNIKGITASFMTSARLLIAAFVVGLTSALYNATIYPLAILIFGTVAFVLPLLISYERRRAKIAAELI
ncbi:MAG: MFS transporter [Chlamydiales bacterium]|nr:MFS transporter [Chlamydiales bacterium]